MRVKFTKDKVDIARAMRAAGDSYRAIAMRFSLSDTTVRCALDPEYGKRRRQRQNDERRSFGLPRQARQKSRPENPIYDPRRDAPMQYDSIGAEIFGDPPVGRRALDIIAIVR